MNTNTRQPKWWTDKESSSWDRVKEALHRDWEQTKNDFSSDSGQDLNQDVTDTVKQAAGKQSIPGPHVANPPDSWENEDAVRYGYGAGVSPNYLAYSNWNKDLETRLETDWNATNPDRPWSQVRGPARFGWLRSHQNVGTKQ